MNRGRSGDVGARRPNPSDPSSLSTTTTNQVRRRYFYRVQQIITYFQEITWLNPQHRPGQTALGPSPKPGQPAPDPAQDPGQPALGPAYKPVPDTEHNPGQLKTASAHNSGQPAPTPAHEPAQLISVPAHRPRQPTKQSPAVDNQRPTIINVDSDDIGVVARGNKRGDCDAKAWCKALIWIIIILGITIFVLWLVYRPAKIKVHVERASLTQFSLIDNIILQFHFSVDMSLRNPNKRVGIYYDRLEVRALYEGERFSLGSLPTFYQGHKNTTMIYLTFRGESIMDFRGSHLGDFNLDKQNETFDISVKIYMRNRYKIGSLAKTARYKQEVECKLRIPLATEAIGGRSFSRTKCDVDI